MPCKEHWDAVYATKSIDEVSWYEADPTISLDLIQQASPLPKSVIDVGGGLPVCRYDAESMASTLGNRFMLVSGHSHVHAAPQGKEQHFFFGVFQLV